MQVRFGYTFKPDLNLDFYAEPFAASGRYERFGELLAARSRDLLIYGERRHDPRPPGRRQLRRSRAETRPSRSAVRTSTCARSAAISCLRWEWRPGSTLYGVWQQNREGAGAPGERAGVGSLFGSLAAAGDNIFAIKASFWITR